MAPGFEKQQAEQLDKISQTMRTKAQAHIQDAAHAISQGDAATARALIQPLLAQPMPDAGPEERLAYLFAQSIQSRMLPPAHTTHLPNLSDEQMEQADQALRAVVPFHPFGYASANAAILRAVMGADHISIVDLGIDGPCQWLQLLDLLAHNPLAPRQLQIVGVRLPQPSSHAIASSDNIGSVIMSCANSLGIDVVYREIDAAHGQLPVPTIHAMAGRGAIVNAAFTLHHTAADDAASTPRQPRDTMLHDVARLRPRLMTLVEPDVEHNALPFSARVCASWYYYHGVFEVLHRCFPLPQQERWSIEQAVFGPQIHNVVTCEGQERYERHERWRAWARRMQSQGFQQISLHAHEYYVNKSLMNLLGTHVTTENGALMLKWQEVPLISASAWRI